MQIIANHLYKKIILILKQHVLYFLSLAFNITTCSGDNMNACITLLSSIAMCKAEADEVRKLLRFLENNFHFAPGFMLILVISNKINSCYLNQHLVFK